MIHFQNYMLISSFIFSIIIIKHFKLNGYFQRIITMCMILKQKQKTYTVYLYQVLK